jgi:hypothetical protein
MQATDQPQQLLLVSVKQVGQGIDETPLCDIIDQESVKVKQNL